MSLVVHQQGPEVAADGPERWKVVPGPWELAAAVAKPSAWEVLEPWAAVATVPVPLLLVGSRGN